MESKVQMVKFIVPNSELKFYVPLLSNLFFKLKDHFIRC